MTLRMVSLSLLKNSLFVTLLIISFYRKAMADLPSSITLEGVAGSYTNFFGDFLESLYKRADVSIEGNRLVAKRWGEDCSGFFEVQIQQREWVEKKEDVIFYSNCKKRIGSVRIKREGQSLRKYTHKELYTFRLKDLFESESFFIEFSFLKLEMIYQKKPVSRLIIRRSNPDGSSKDSLDFSKIKTKEGYSMDYRFFGFPDRNYYYIYGLILDYNFNTGQKKYYKDLKEVAEKDLVGEVLFAFDFMRMELGKSLLGGASGWPNLDEID